MSHRAMSKLTNFVTVWQLPDQRRPTSQTRDHRKPTLPKRRPNRDDDDFATPSVRHHRDPH